jgi:hypothetical protein
MPALSRNSNPRRYQLFPETENLVSSPQQCFPATSSGACGGERIMDDRRADLAHVVE